MDRGAAAAAGESAQTRDRRRRPLGAGLSSAAQDRLDRPGRCLAVAVRRWRRRTVRGVGGLQRSPSLGRAGSAPEPDGRVAHPTDWAQRQLVVNLRAEAVGAEGEAMNTLTGTLAILLLATAAAEAQQHQHAAATTPPATLVDGMGRLHHAIATTNADAQRFFNQGLTYVYGFNHDEAIRSFRRAAELDPSSPMPHWGIALALGPNINLDVDPEREKAAYDEAQKAKALLGGAPAIERAYVEALAVRYSDDPKADLKALAVK